MKSTIATGLICLLIGIAIGWVAKPSDQTLAQASPEAPATKAKPRPSPAPAGFPSDSGEAGTPTTSTVVFGGDTEMTEEQKKMIEDSRKQMEKMVFDRQRKQFDLKIATLVRKLNLDGHQEAALKTFFDERAKELAGVMGMNESPGPEGMKEMTDLVRNDGLDDEMAELLSPEQLEAYEAMKAKERSRKMDSSALKGLAKLNGMLELSADQKDAVYEVLYEQAGDKIDNPSDASLLMSLSMQGMGVEMDIEDSYLEDMMDMQVTAMGEDGEFDQKKLLAQYQERAAKRIDEKVARFEGILTPDQSAQYREQLEANQVNMSGAIFGVSETESAIHAGSTKAE